MRAHKKIKGVRKINIASTIKITRTIKVVAAFEAFKGFVAFAAASGLLLLFHRDLHELATDLVAHAHLDPAAKFPRIFIAAAMHLQNLRLTLLALGAAAYSVIRFIEAYGLFREAAWAEVLAAASGAIYVPFEIAGLLHRFSWLSVAALILNIGVVVVMVWALLLRRGRDNIHTVNSQDKNNKFG